MDVENVRGGWILDTEWDDPKSLEDMEESGDEELLSFVSGIISNPLTPWEDCDSSDQFRTEWIKMFHFEMFRPTKN